MEGVYYEPIVQMNKLRLRRALYLLGVRHTAPKDTELGLVPSITLPGRDILSRPLL